MRIYLGALVFLLLQFGAVSLAAESVSLATLRVHRGYGTFFVQVSDSGDHTLHRKIRIECVEKCRQPVFFEEKLVDPVLGVFTLSDRDDIIFSIWASGTAYVVRAYKIGPTSAVKVFEEYSKWYPYFIGSSSPGVVIRTFLYDERADPTREEPKPRDWRWDGVAFTRIPAKAGNPLLPAAR